jgi:integrase
MQPNEREPFTREELQILLEKTTGEWPDMVAVCLLLGGARLGELARLKWSHCDFDANLVVIRTRKTNRGMTKPMILPLKKILQRRREAGEKWSEYVFPFAKMRVDQAAGDSSKLSTDFSNLVQELGIKCELRPEENAPKNARKWNPKTFHSLRTTATTFLLDVGCPAELVRHIVGHDDAEIERRHYYRPTGETQQNYIQKIGELLGL